MTSSTRRKMLLGSAAAGAVASLTQLRSVAASGGSTAPHIATNTYPWLTFARRAERKFDLHSNQLLADIARTGITGYEPIIDSPAEFDGLQLRLKAHGLQMHSIYVNSVLHDAATVEESSANVLEIAEKAKNLGTKIVVTNPSPIRWGGTEDKTDAQLRLQAQSLDALGAELRKIGVALAYHNHDAELRQGAREFHHMLTSTDPENVKFCLDAHWIYRGCGNSEVAVFDAFSLYCDRIIELHLRQSQGNAWTEAFSMQGDIDYIRLFDFLQKKEIAPHLCLEQAVEAASPSTMDVVDAHTKGNDNLTKALV